MPSVHGSSIIAIKPKGVFLARPLCCYCTFCENITRGAAVGIHVTFVKMGLVKKLNRDAHAHTFFSIIIELNDAFIRSYHAFKKFFAV